MDRRNGGAHDRHDETGDSIPNATKASGSEPGERRRRRSRLVGDDGFGCTQVIAPLRRQLAFARHLAPTQVIRRLLLKLRRQVEARLRPSLDAGQCRLAALAPVALLQSRSPLAQRTADGWRFTFLGRTASCGTTVDWQLPGHSAGSQLWRMNLHYFEHSEGLDDESFGLLVDQWIAANPAYGSGSTEDSWNAYALSIRVTVWLQQAARRRLTLDPQLLARLVGSAARQLIYLERHIESDIGGNHLIKNIKALLWGALAIDCPAAARWRRTGLRLLEREFAQILPDGLHFELSPSYHCQVLADLIEIRHALGIDPFGGRLDTAITAAAQAAADLAHPDGMVAQFGDSGLTMAYLPAALGEACRRLLGRPTAPRRAFVLPDGGYCGIRDQDAAVIVDCGALGSGRLPGHAHGDMFAFEWSVGGKRLVVDQGVFEYVAGKRRQASRSTSFHNSVAAPGADQGEFFGAFRLGRRCRPAAVRAVASEQSLLVEGGHSGFVGPSGGVRHHRRIEATPRRIAVVDRLDRRLAGASATLLLAPDARPVAAGAGKIEIHGYSSPIEITASTPIEIEPAEWWPDMGKTIPTTRLRLPLTDLELRFELNALDAGAGAA